MLDQYVIRTFEELKAVSDPLRSRILAVLSRGAMTTLQVARELGEKPTRLYHHVEILERAGLICLVREQPKRGTVERYLEPVARVFVVDRKLFNASEPAPADAASTARSLVDGVLGQTLDELRGRISEGALPLGDPRRMKLARLHLRGTGPQIARVTAAVEALIEAANQLADEPDTGETATDDAIVHDYRLQLAFYPLGERPRDDPPFPSAPEDSEA